MARSARCRRGCGRCWRSSRKRGCTRPARRCGSRPPAHWRRASLVETGPLSRGVQARRKAPRTRHINGMEVRKKRPRGFKKEAQGVQASPLNPLSVAPCCIHIIGRVGELEAERVGRVAGHAAAGHGRRGRGRAVARPAARVRIECALVHVQRTRPPPCRPRRAALAPRSPSAPSAPARGRC